jgi:hypothetical protein
MNEKRKKKPEKFTDMLRPWIVARCTDGNVVIGREVFEGVRDGDRTKRCFVIEGLPPQGAVATTRTPLVDFNNADEAARTLGTPQPLS